MKNQVKIHIHATPQDAGAAAARQGAECIRKALRERGYANIIVATGASQFQTLEALVQEPDIAWDRVVGFHLDEYVGIPVNHPASFRKYLWDRFVSRLPVPLADFHYIRGDSDPQKECDRVGRMIQQHPIDLCFAGIGENGHLAFNDPPADFATESPYLVVALDEACRKQQMGEGWFGSLGDVPTHAISMSIRQILKAATIICTVVDERKAVAVRDCLSGPVTPHHPSSILQTHADATCHLDLAASALLPEKFPA